MPFAEPVHRAPAYRADIDGLRALSVVAIILFHAELAGVGGGFVGVDVFFVISGFLITRLIVPGAADTPALPLGEFYLRRARRILPALLVMLALTTVAALVLFTPAELRYYGEALRWCAAMLANVSAWRFGDYFEPPWSYVPLRHLWSIAVEEQFYLLYPLATLAGLRFWPKRLAAVVMVMTAASFAFSVWASDAHPVANYFAPPSRAWELLAGACVALGVFPRVANRTIATLLAGSSLLALLAIMALYRTGLPFPGWYALPPCLATVLLLVTGGDPGTPVHRMLAWRPLVFLGLISYSLYLWHAPVQIFLRYYLIQKPGLLATCGMLGATVLIATASWVFIEKPIRRASVLRDRRVFVAVMVAASCALVVSGALLWRSSGLPQRFSAQTLRLMRDENVYFKDAARCIGLSREQIAAGDLCRYGASGAGKPRIVLWGDSHAWMLVPAFDRLAREHDMELLFAGRTECRPLVGVRSAVQQAGVRGRVQRLCEQFNEEMIRAIDVLRPSVIVFAAYWNHPDATPEPTAGAALARGESGLARGIESMIAALPATASRVCVVLDVPLLPYSAAHALSMARRRGIDHDFLLVPRTTAFAQHRLADTAFAEVAARGELRIVDPKPALCRGAQCLVLDADGTSLYWDDNHLSMRGAQFVAPSFARCLDP